MAKLKASYPFSTAEEALENITSIAQGLVTDCLKNFLTTNLPATKSSSKQKFMLGISDTKLGSNIKEATGITASFNDSIVEMIRGIRMHFTKLNKKMSDADLGRA